MALGDIKDAGILAGFAVWGWPYHGLCAGGSITLPNAATHPMIQPPNELTWLIDMGLQPIERSPTELLADAAAGFEWRNYALISGGMIYGKALNAGSFNPDAFIHVDIEGKRWLVKWISAYITTSKLAAVFTFSACEFGRLVTDGATALPVEFTVVIPSDSMASAHGVFDLEDVWTNGSRALLGIYRIVPTSQTTDGTPIEPWLKDMVSLVEVVISGAGGADGSGLVFSGTEIRGRPQLDYPETIRAPGTAQTDPMVPGYSYICTQDQQTSVITCQYIQSGFVSFFTAMGGILFEDSEFYPTAKARFAYYKPDGSAVAAKLKIGSNESFTIGGLTLQTSGADVFDPNTSTWDYGAHAIYTGSGSGVCRQGIYLMEDNAIIDKIEFVQNIVFSRTADQWQGGSPVITYSPNLTFYDVGHWESNLTASISIPTMRNEFGKVSFTVAQTLMEAWRKLADDTGASTGNYERSGSGIDDVTWGTGFGIQRIAERAAGFFKLNGATRTYGAIMSPYGVLAAGVTSSANIYLTGNRKTGAVMTAESSICYV